MRFQIWIGKSYMLDKSTNIVHDLSCRKFSGCGKDKAAYLKFHEALIMVVDEEGRGCAKCLPGLNKID